MVLSKDFKEFIKLLNENEVRYLLVGGYAIAMHGHPRYTKDMDLWIWLNKRNAEKLLVVLDRFGFSGLNYRIEDFLNPENVIQLGVPPNRIDLITDLTGVEFETCYESRIKIKIDEIEIPLIDLENLKKNKRALGRHQDLADLENLE
jgi:predicted nucleotidyltransferase